MEATKMLSKRRAELSLSDLLPVLLVKTPNHQT